MNQQHFLKLSFWMSVSALITFIITTVVALSARGNGVGNGGQEQFEFFRILSAYTSDLHSAGPVLRQVLFLDSIFILCYASAIGFAVAAFYHRNHLVAWASGFFLFAVIILDNWENIIMIQSLDVVKNGLTLNVDNVLHQVTVSSAKWLAACSMLFCLSFVLPDHRFVEKLLVWGTRTGLAIGVPLFIYNPMDLRLIGGAIIALSMAGGFVLLALVTHGRRITK